MNGIKKKKRKTKNKQKRKKKNWSLLNRKEELVGEVAGSRPERKDPALPVAAYQTSCVGLNDHHEVIRKLRNRCR